MALLISVLLCTCILSIVEWDNLEYVYARSSFIIVFSGFLGESLVPWIVLDVGFLVLNAINLEVVWLMRRKLKQSLEVIEATDV